MTTAFSGSRANIQVPAQSQATHAPAPQPTAPQAPARVASHPAADQTLVPGLQQQTANTTLQPVRQAAPQATPPHANPASTADRRADTNPQERLLGRVISIDGGFAKLAATALEPEATAGNFFWAIGRLISISVGEARVVGLVYRIDTNDNNWDASKDNEMTISVELIGEISEDIRGKPGFSRGINTYPPLGSVAHRIRAGDLAIIHNPQGRQPVTVGTLSQDESIPAVVCIDDMIKRHFAVVGSTGTGKSTSVSLLLRKIVETRPGLRVLILDPHNEYATAFPNQCQSISTDTLELPYWLFQQEELCDVIFRGRDGVEEEVDTLRDLIPEAKARFSQKLNVGAGLRKTGAGPTITTDTPIPYRMSDLFALIEEGIGQLESRHDRSVLKSLKSRLESLINDPRYRFMFSQRTVEDNMAEVLGSIFRVPVNAKPITVFQLASLPSEVVNAVVSVLCRLAFDLTVWSKGTCEVLVLCEEAHRYVPLDHNHGFGPTRAAIARIAKEGRKYGAYLGVVTQRPGELDPTILSQCSTVFAMRLANEHDQSIIRSAIPDSSVSTMSFLSSIGNQEAIAFGEGIATPMRMRFQRLSPAEIPGSAKNADENTALGQAQPMDLTKIITSMRNMHNRG